MDTDGGSVWPVGELCESSVHMCMDGPIQMHPKYEAGLKPHQVLIGPKPYMTK